MNNIEKQLEIRNNADYKCYQILKQVYNAIDYNPGLKQFQNIIKEFYADEEAAKELIEDMKEAIEIREQANENFLRSFASKK